VGKKFRYRNLSLSLSTFSLPLSLFPLPPFSISSLHCLPSPVCPLLVPRTVTRCGELRDDKWFLMHSESKIMLLVIAQLQKFSDNQITEFRKNQGCCPCLSSRTNHIVPYRPLPVLQWPTVSFNGSVGVRCIMGLVIKAQKVRRRAASSCNASQIREFRFSTCGPNVK